MLLLSLVLVGCSPKSTVFKVTPTAGGEPLLSCVVLAEILMGHGFSHVEALSGGLDAKMGAGYPTAP